MDGTLTSSITTINVVSSFLGRYLLLDSFSNNGNHNTSSKQVAEGTVFVGLRDLGPALPPQSAFQIIQGLETVALRMKQHCSNAEKVVNFLDGHKKVKKVIYPTNYQGEIRDRAKKYMQGGYGSLIGMDPVSYTHLTLPTKA